MGAVTKAWILAISLFCAACGGDSPQFELPGADASSSSLEYPAKETSDRVALCDNAPLGTPCDQRGSHMHCVAQVCVRNACGDGVKAELEQCDDGNQASGDGCSVQCRDEASAGSGSECGNGVIDPSEACDDGNSDEQDGCDSRCRLARKAPQLRAADAGSGAAGKAGKGGAGGMAAVGGSEPSAGAGGAGSGGAGSAGNQAGESGATAGMVAAGGAGNQAGESGAAAGMVAAGAAGADPAGNGATPSAECQACRETHCRSYNGLDVVGGCLERVDVTQGAGAQDASFVEDCTAVVACAIQSRCADSIFGAADCYCGSAATSACSTSGPQGGSCRAEIQRATRSLDPRDVMLRMRLKSYPMGWAFELLECDRQHCQSSCAP